jgi:cell division protein FtsW (lipid II flippase)
MKLVITMLVLMAVLTNWAAEFPVRWIFAVASLGVMGFMKLGLPIMVLNNYTRKMTYNSLNEHMLAVAFFIVALQLLPAIPNTTTETFNCAALLILYTHFVTMTAEVNHLLARG